MKHQPTTQQTTCSFCGKRQEPGRRVIAGPGVYICSECVTLCVDILSNQPPAQGNACSTPRPRAQGAADRLRRLLSGMHNASHIGIQAHS